MRGRVRHRREIAIVVQQRVVMLYAERTDDDAGCLADRDAQFSKLAVVPGGARGQIGSRSGTKDILAQSAVDAHSMGFVAGAPKDLEQGEIADQEGFQSGGGLRFGRRPHASH